MQFEMITGSLGKTDYPPYVFNVFTNVVNREAMKRVIRVILDMYVDDIMGICVKDECLERNLVAAIKDFMEALWGIGGGRQYDVDIVEQRVRMSTKNRLKTIRLLFRIDEDAGITGLDVMRLASYASR